MAYVWQILDVYADGETITSARYFCSLTEEGKCVETEGYWKFQNAKAVVPFAKVTEAMIAKWIEDESSSNGESVIKSRLKEQLQSMKTKAVPAPWLPQTFTPDL